MSLSLIQNEDSFLHQVYDYCLCCCNFFKTAGFMPDIDYTFDIHHCKEIGCSISIDERDKLSNGGYMSAIEKKINLVGGVTSERLGSKK